MRWLVSPLTYRERLTLAWQLCWPAVAADFVWSFSVYVVLGVQKPGAEILYLIPYLLIVAPWLVRRMFRRSYPGFRLKVLVDGAETPIGYTESFKVMWLLSWRTGVLLLVLLFLVSLFGSLIQVPLASLVPKTEEAPFLNMFGVSVFENGAALFLMPLVMPGMFNKRYQGFRVAVERTGEPRGAARPLHPSKKTAGKRGSR